MTHARKLRRNDRPMPCDPHPRRLARVPPHLDRLLHDARLGPALTGPVAVGVRLELLQHQVLDRCQRRRRPPRDAPVMTPDDARQTRHARPRRRELRTVQMDEIPVRGEDRRQMGIAGEQRPPGIGPLRRDRPVVAAQPRRAQQRLSHRTAVRRHQLIRQRPVGRPRRIDHRARRRRSRIDGVDRLHPRRFDQPGPQDLDLPGRGQHEGQHLAPQHRVLRSPGLGIVVQDPQLQRRRRAFEGRIDSMHVGHEPALQLRRHRLPSQIRRALHPQMPHQPVGRQPLRSRHLRHPALRRPPVELHLPEPILAVHKAQREQRVVRVPREAMRHAGPIPHDLDRRM